MDEVDWRRLVDVLSSGVHARQRKAHILRQVHNIHTSRPRLPTVCSQNAQMDQGQSTLLLIRRQQQD
jgi:hypothetical protein